MEPSAGGERTERGASGVPEAAALFCLIAVRSGLLPQARADEALAAALASGGAVADVCVANGWLTEGQARTVLAHVAAPEGAEPAVDGEDAREFARLVAMKRLARDGQVDACRELQKDLAGGAYGRLSELLVRRASRRSSDAARGAPAGMPGRSEAFDLYVKLKQAVQRGDVEQAGELARRLRGDPEYGRLAETQLDRAFARRAATDARRTGGGVTRCAGCGTPGVGLEGLGDKEAVAKCPRCLANLAAPPPDETPTS